MKLWQLMMGEEAQRLLLWHEDADMAVVDIMLPGKDGVCTDGRF